jgi:hypothetical protein
LTLLLQLAVAAPGAAVELLVETTASPDIAIAVDSGTLLALDEDAIVTAAGPPLLAALGPLPPAADLAAYHRRANGDELFSLDTAAALSGPLHVEPRDIALWDGAVFSLVFDGSVEGVPDGARIDAVSDADDGGLLLSFDITVALGGTTFDDADLVHFDAAGPTFSLLFDSAAASVPAALDLDAAHFLFATGGLLLSFDSSGSLGGVSFDDEDVLEYDPGSGIWALSVDTQASEPGWAGADLDALHALRSCVGLGGDSDGDQLCDAEDPCPSYPNVSLVDSNGDGIPNECQCGDANGDGIISSTDLVPMNLCASNSSLCDQSLVDANGDGITSSTDIVPTNLVANGAPAYTLRCARRLEGTPAI